MFYMNWKEIGLRSFKMILKLMN
ncbi:hypothetical protein XAC3218_1100003 [Xanthomonas citri pv. citri]|nr:hypothetical protein XAC3218_1100003 [Xanthomonas citri pv. citri]CEH82176.1 hypothetical protein XACB302_10440003 [Xanthomonas citri pv. citri]